MYKIEKTEDKHFPFQFPLKMETNGSKLKCPLAVEFLKEGDSGENGKSERKWQE